MADDERGDRHGVGTPLAAGGEPPDSARVDLRRLIDQHVALTTGPLDARIAELEEIAIRLVDAVRALSDEMHQGPGAERFASGSAQLDALAAATRRLRGQGR